MNAAVLVGFRLTLTTIVLGAIPSYALSAPPTTYAGQAPVDDDEPPPPIPPAVISRDPTTGRATLRAVRATTALRIDGRLDEAIYTDIPAISDFIQMEPQAGEPATERTELWILFDNENVYLTFRCWESHPERMVVKEMRRDNSNLWQGENVAFLLDTFHDRRNGVEFGITPSGGRYEGQVTNERVYNGDWNPVWHVAVGRFDGGWIAEAAIPFKSLRYQPGREQMWGFQARRINAWKNELSFLTRLPPELGMGRGIFAASLAPVIVGLEAPSHSRTLELKPYARGDISTNPVSTTSNSTRFGQDVGFDAKYGLGRNLSSDLTVNTDFAQVEADDQQLNLTRFRLFFPEKRDFFLENQGTFTFGGTGSVDMPILFYSRRIGLSGGREVPILAGGRVTGRVGPTTIGALTIESGAQSSDGPPVTNFSVVRLKRDVLRRSSIGFMATSRSGSEPYGPGNPAHGVDGVFAISQNVTINAYWAQTRPAVVAAGDTTSYRTQVEYVGDRLGVQLERLVVGRDFDPAIGFVRRPDMHKTLAYLRYSPRPRGSQRIRKFYWNGTASRITNSLGNLETRDVLAEFAVDFQNGDHMTVQHESDVEHVPRAFSIAPDVTVPIGSYRLETTRAGYTLGPQRRVVGTLLVEYGPSYSGIRSAVTVSSARLNPALRLSLEPTYSLNRIRLPQGEFSATLAGLRSTYTVTPLMFASAFVQFNSTTGLLSANLRLRWEYRPGSELFVVYSDERTTLLTQPSIGASRALIIKVNRLIRP